jgi:hypothetical protein
MNEMNKSIRVTTSGGTPCKCELSDSTRAEEEEQFVDIGVLFPDGLFAARAVPEPSVAMAAVLRARGACLKESIVGEM